MDWIRVTICTTTEGIEPVTGRLYQLGVTGVEIEDEKDFQEFLTENTPHWDYVDEELVKQKSGETKVILYLSANASGNETLLAVKESLRRLKELDEGNAFGRLEVSLSNISDEDWANNWKQYFKPIFLGKNILIKPEWEPLPEGSEGKTVFTVDPGMSFGTGSHFSTQLCIELMEKYLKRGGAVLDLGCGSGILSVIALLLGASHALAVDIDPNAVPVALANARRNHVDPEKYEVLAGDIVTDEALVEKIGYQKYDAVFANIVADVIIASVQRVAKQLKPDGVFITSGIIRPRSGEVLAALDAAGFEVVETGERSDWLALACQLRA